MLMAGMILNMTTDGWEDLKSTALKSVIISKLAQETKHILSQWELLLVQPEELRAVAVEEFVRSYFGGSRDELRRWLDGSPRKEALEPSGSNDPMDTALL